MSVQDELVNGFVLQNARSSNDKVNELERELAEMREKHRLEEQKLQHRIESCKRSTQDWLFKLI